MSNKKNIGLFLILLILLTSCFSFATIVNYTVTSVYTQEKDQWCWNATSRMAAKYKYAVTLSQTQMARKIFPLAIDTNQTATLKQTAAALKLYTASTKSTGYTEDPVAWDFIYTKLSESKTPIVIGLYDGYKWHALTVYKMDTVTKEMFCIDPYDGQFSHETIDTYNSDFGWEFEGLAYYLKGQW